MIKLSENRGCKEDLDDCFIRLDYFRGTSLSPNPSPVGRGVELALLYTRVTSFPSSWEEGCPKGGVVENTVQR